MIQVQRSARLILFSVWAVLMTALTYILGAPSLKVLRRRMGRLNYWALIFSISGTLFFVRSDFRMLAIAFFSLSVLMGVLEEFEEMQFSLEASVFYTLLINSLLAAGAFALWVFVHGAQWDASLLAGLEAMLKPVADLNPHLQLNYFDLMLQLPSIAIILWIGAIYLAILLEGRLGMGDMAPAKPLPSLRPQLARVRLPDACIWVFIASLLFAFGELGGRAVEAVAVNAMNISVVLLFFQGIAVVSKFFATVRMGTFWQVLFMILIVVQLFLFVSLLGLLDFWLDFRVRMAKRAGQVNRET